MSSPPRDAPDAPCNSLSRSAPECSVLLCGLSTSLLTLTSSLKWGTDCEVKDGATILFRDASQEPQHLTQTHLLNQFNLCGSRSGLMFLHDASSSNVEDSVVCLRRYRKLQLRYCDKSFFWVVISSPDNLDSTPRSDGLVARFERELRSAVNNHAFRESGAIGCRVIETEVGNACREMGEHMRSMPGMVLPSPRRPDRSPGELTIEEFMHGFLYGTIAPWSHNEYLRAAYITLLEPEDKEVPLLEMATRFEANVTRFKQRNCLPNPPESRTLTVFWVYHIRLAMSVMRVYETKAWEYYNFKRLLHFIPEIANEDLPTTYYSPDILNSEYSERFWMLPNLRELIEPIEHPDLSFRERFTKKQPEDPERLLRFAFAVMQRYLRPGEIRGRSWFINVAFASLQQQITRLRSMRPQVSPYSETQSYFYLQLVHAALSRLIYIGGPELVQELSYPQFKATFSILPSAWTTYYRPSLWNSLKARVSFVPPDRKPLPDTICPPPFWIGPTHRNAKARFHKPGLIPELPSPEILHFHRALLLEDAKSLPPTLPPSAVTTHAHLLKYIHTHLILPQPSPESTATHHAKLLTTASPLPRRHITYYLHLLHTPGLQPPYTPPPPTRFHNCACHAAVPIPALWSSSSPNAVAHPDNAVQRLGQRREQARWGLRHGCVCHGGEMVVGELLEPDDGRLTEGGGVAGEMVAESETGTEMEGGDGGWERGVEWEEWVRGKGGLVFCWDRAWKEGGGGEVSAVVGGEGEGREDGDSNADEKTLGGEECDSLEKEGKDEGGGCSDADEKTLRGEERDIEGKEGKVGGEESGHADVYEQTLRGEERDSEEREGKGDGQEGSHADADEKTLSDKEDKEEEDWEVVSQDTPS